MASHPHTRATMLETVKPVQVSTPVIDSKTSLSENGDSIQSTSIEDQWAGSTLPPQIPVSHPWLSRYYPSVILKNSFGPSGPPTISTINTEVYGNPVHPILFRIGNGGAGYTRILELLCNKFIWTHGSDFCIGWVANHSRHSHIALLADVVQVTLTYEPEVEELTVKEGWCRRVQAPSFWDHFVLVGPKSNPAGLEPGCRIGEALGMIATTGALFQTRGDGSATFKREIKLWKAAGVDTSSVSWLQTHPIPPYKALEKAAQDGAYILTDRGTFLTAKQDGTIPDLVVCVEGGKQLQNPCSALINTKVPDSLAQRMAVQFAEWLGGETAQSIFRGYGRVWAQGMPLFTPAEQVAFGEEDRLVGRDL